jgi:hypothetical protein
MDRFLYSLIVFCLLIGLVALAGLLTSLALVTPV